MSVISFTGTVKQNLWNNEVVNPGSQRRPGPEDYPYNTLGSIRTYNPYNTRINWNTNVPALIDGLSVNQIVNILYNNQQAGQNNYSIANSHVFTIKGNQDTEFGDQRYINLGIFSNDAENMVFARGNVAALNGGFYCNQNVCPTFTYNEPAVVAGFSIFQVQVNPWNDSVNTNYTVINFTLDVVMTVTINFFCTGDSLNTEICTQLCTLTDNIKTGLCFQNYLDYCFSPGPTGITGATGPILFENGGNNACDTYFQTYLGQQGPGPNKELDTKLDEVCGFITDLNEFNKQTPGPNGIQNICACHIDSQFYQNIENSINSLPGGAVVDVPAVCLFQPCVDSVYKPNLTGKVCPTIPCINIADIENRGTIKGGTTINQSCLQSSSTITKYLIFIIPAIFIILIVIVVVFILIFKAK